jgi:hypothetical protein
MKASKRITTWIIISLVLQCGIYLYMDKFYYASEGDFNFTEGNSVDIVKDIKPSITFPSNATDISLSYDCSYTAYMEDGIIKVYDTSTGKAKKLNFGAGVTCLSYKWLPDSNSMMIAERVNSGGKKVIKFYSYDADSEDKKDTDNYLSGGHKVNAMPSVSSKDKVEFEISSSTGVLYGKITYGIGEVNLYRIDRNEDLTRVNTVSRNIGNIAVASDDDQLAYEDLNSEKIRTNYKSKIISVGGTSRLTLLGTDSDDDFYVGVGKTVSKIYYGKLTESTSTWNELSLDQSSEAPNIVITASGNVYNIDKSQSSVTNVKTSKTYSFEGDFLGINDSYLSYKSNNVLKLKAVK